MCARNRRRNRKTERADMESARATSAKRSSIVFGRMAPMTDAALTPEQITGKRIKES